MLSTLRPARAALSRACYSAKGASFGAPVHLHADASRAVSAYLVSGSNWRRFVSPSAGDSQEGKEPGKEPDKEPPSSSSSSEQKKEPETKETKSTGKNDDNGNWQPNWSTVLAGAVSAGFLFYTVATQETPQEITVQEFIRDHVVEQNVEMIQIVNHSTCRAYLKRDTDGPSLSAYGKPYVIIQLGSAEGFEFRVEHAQQDLGVPSAERIPIQYVVETNWSDYAVLYGPQVLMLLVLLFAGRGMSGALSSGMPGAGSAGGKGRNMFNMGKAFAGGKPAVKSDVRFKDVAGQEQAKREVVEFVDFLKNPEKYRMLGARVPKGGLLVGPPGTGKTLLAKAVAGEADCPFYTMSGSDFVEMYGGVGAARMRDLFKLARESAPSIVFIDEIDAIGRKRSQSSAGGNDERESTLNQMLVEMDGFQPSSGVVVLAGTNRADILDDALKRPGRFDRLISVDRPDLGERTDIFKVHLKPVKLEKELPVESVAKRLATLTPGMTGADIANICNEAAIVAARREAKAVEMNDFERATERVLAGLPKSNNMMDKNQRKAVALHECGHAVVGWFLKHADPLLKVSIVPRSSGALGFAQYLPEEVALHSREAILDKMAVSLGGRAAEELFVGRISTGASDDLDKVTKMAYSMTRVYGMIPEIGLLSYGQGGESQFYKPYSEETSRRMDQEARRLVDVEYLRVKELLSEKRDVVESMAQLLLEKETLVYADLLQVLGDRPHVVPEHYASFLNQSNPFTAPIDNSEAGPAGAETQGQEVPVLACKSELDGK